MLSSAAGKLVLYIVIHATYINCAIAYAISKGNIAAQSRMESAPSIDVNPDVAVSFSHFHMYVDKVDDLATYKTLENNLNAFTAVLTDKDGSLSAEEKNQLWGSLCSDDGVHCNRDDVPPFAPQNRDVIRQLIAGLGFRVVGYGDHALTRTVLISSRDPNGVQILISAMKHTNDNCDDYTATSAVPTQITCNYDKIKRFMESHRNRQGIGVLAFNANNIRTLHDKYLQLHPTLIDSFTEDAQNNSLVLEVFAYYHKRDSNTPDNEARQVDMGTILRFVEFKDQDNKTTDPILRSCMLFGMDYCQAIFDDSSMPAYCDHWVSNVFDRTEFIKTLSDTLGFIPKVDFNAGVVAAGEAQIESTVIGNASKKVCYNKAVALTDQSQVYLPINNALSSVGHVHGFLQEIGQGVQHVASRVENLVSFVQRCNEYRQITNEGFTFLQIPRSYYGILTSKLLTDVHSNTGSHINENCANEIIDCLHRSSVLTQDGALDLYVNRATLESILDVGLSASAQEDYLQNRDSVLAVISGSRYRNLRSLLGDTVSEAEYLGIVRNQILVDVQGDDLLYQIFTSNILQRDLGEEAPFLEFIQRVCAKDVVRPGCGGFGIRNFLTLFLSIEVSKAMQDVADARKVGDAARQKYAQTMVDYFTDQMNEANPILTQISEAMTEEGKCIDKLAELTLNNQLEEVGVWQARLIAAAERKSAGNTLLMECSSRYNDMMKRLRESR